ncbi:MAG: hypothetical protein ABIK68_06440 [bacterium]
MRHFLLTGLSVVLVLTLFACKDLLTSHDINLDGVKHGEKLYSGAKNCTACHGLNLNGNGSIPACYSCHDALWSYDFHTRIRGGVGHRTGLFPESNCAGCHGGTTLRGKRSRPSCYSCHGDVWSALAIHTVSEEGVYHAPGLKTPLDNCVACHGSDLRGKDNAPSCYLCHGNKWDEGGDD